MGKTLKTATKEALGETGNPDKPDLRLKVDEDGNLLDCDDKSWKREPSVPDQESLFPATTRRGGVKTHIFDFSKVIRTS